MNGENSTAQKVLDALVGTGLLTTEQVSNVSEAAAAEAIPVGPLLVERGLISSDDVANVLEEEMGVPRVELSSYAPEEDALARIPAALARNYRILPLFDIEGMLTVAIGDPVDVFRLDDVGAQVGVEIEAVLADVTELRGALVTYYGESTAEPVAPETGVPAHEVFDDTPTVVDPPEVEMPVVDDVPALVDDAAGDAASGVADETADDVALARDIAPAAPAIDVADDVAQTPDTVITSDQPLETLETVAVAAPAESGGIDLDVLAVADPNKVGVLVSDIFEAAVKAGASHIQILPYKHDFFLVFRVKGRLEKVASAPLSLQAALVDGFKHFAKLAEVSSSLPALGRVRADYGGRDLAVTVSAVPTVSGQRVVITLRSNEPTPQDLSGLGVTEAEEKALQAMTERGRGLLLVCAPVAGGRSETYYSLLSHAADVGKTVYSVERTISYELPAVAQVMVNPGSPVRPSAYIAAGLRQDTDVVAVDSLQSTEDVHLAVEAAGRGRLVVATFAAADIMSGVRRILDLGVEPHSLAAALTFAVGQRLVRTNCPNCIEDVRDPLNTIIPGLADDAVTKRSTGCPNCRKSGFSGVTGIFEVLPFTETIRAAVARDADLHELEKTASAAGMRALVRSGVAKVEAGSVSVEELARVLRFDE